MSTISFGAGSVGLVLADASASKTRLDQLTEQTSSGLIAPSYGGLSRTQAARALSLRPLLTSQQAVRDGIDAVQGRLDVAQTALNSISSIASMFYAKVPSLNGLNSGEIDSIAADARDALRQVAGLLDTQEDGVYVFAGDDTAHPPVPDPDAIAASPFATAISAAVAGLAANGATSTIAATLVVAGTGSGSVSPFSNAITSNSVNPPIVAAGPDQTVTVGVVAGSNGAVASEGSSTTGSYARDILRALATIGSLSSSQVSDPNFTALTGDIYTSLGGAVTALNQDAGVLGDRQTALAQTKTTLGDMSTALTTQVSGVEQVDMTATLSQLTQAQTQLQSSYQVIASLQSLSLTRYLTP